MLKSEQKSYKFIEALIFNNGQPFFFILFIRLYINSHSVYRNAFGPI